MTRKDFELIARSLNYTKPSEPTYNAKHDYRMAYTAWHNVVQELSIELLTNNARFDAKKFIAACGA